MKRITASLLVVLAGWLGFATAAQAQMPTPSITWTYTPKLALTDATGAELAAPGGSHAIPYADRNTRLRLNLSLSITASARLPEAQLNNIFSGDLLDNLGTSGGVRMGIFLDPTGSASATTTQEIVRDTLVVGAGSDISIGGEANHLTFNPATSEMGSVSLAPSFTAARVDDDGSWRFAWRESDSIEVLRGSWCAHASDADPLTCDITMGYIELDPSEIPVGGGFSAQVGGYTLRGAEPFIDPFQQAGSFGVTPVVVNDMRAENGVSVTMSPPLFTISSDDPAITLREGESTEFVVSTDQMLGESAVVTLDIEGVGAGATAADVEVIPPIPYTFTPGGVTTVTLTATALRDGVKESTETLNVRLGAVARAGLASSVGTTTLTILDVTPATAGEPVSGTVPEGEFRVTGVLPEGFLAIDNQTDDEISVMQADTSSNVIVTITDGDGDAGEFVGTELQMSPMLFAGPDPNLADGITIDATLAISTDAIVNAAASRAPAGFVKPRAGDNPLSIIDITVEPQGGGSLAGDVHVCLPFESPDAPEGSDGASPSLFRFDGSAWVETGASSLTGANNICGTTLEFSAFAVFFPSTAVPDFNADDGITRDDALILFYAYSLRDALGAGR